MIRFFAINDVGVVIIYYFFALSLKLRLSLSLRIFSCNISSLRLSRPSIRSKNSNQRNANSPRPLIHHHEIFSIKLSSRSFIIYSATTGTRSFIVFMVLAIRRMNEITSIPLQLDRASCCFKPTQWCFIIGSKMIKVNQCN